MQLIAIDVTRCMVSVSCCFVCLSVWHSRKLCKHGWTSQDAIWGQTCVCPLNLSHESIFHIGKEGALGHRFFCMLATSILIGRPFTAGFFLQPAVQQWCGLLPYFCGLYCNVIKYPFILLIIVQTQKIIKVSVCLTRFVPNSKDHKSECMFDSVC